MNAPGPSTVTLLALIPLLGWRVYRRFRRLVGRQRLSGLRLRTTLAVYSALLALICLAARSHPEQLWWLAGGLGLGSLLGLFGLGRTRFEPTPGGLHNTPHAHLGIALSLLFVARILYRVFEAYSDGTQAPRGLGDFAHSAPTLAVFGLLAGYYISYAVGLLRWRWRVLRDDPQRGSSEKGTGTIPGQSPDPAAAPGMPPAGPESSDGQAPVSPTS